MGHGCKWDVSSSNDTHIQSYIGHTKKQIIELVIASHATNIMPKEKCRFVGPQNGPTPHEHATQGLHFVMGVTQPIHLFTLARGNCIRTWIDLPYAQRDQDP